MRAVHTFKKDEWRKPESPEKTHVDTGKNVPVSYRGRWNFREREKKQLLPSMFFFFFHCDTALNCVWLGSIPQGALLSSLCIHTWIQRLRVLD